MTSLRAGTKVVPVSIPTIKEMNLQERNLLENGTVISSTSSLNNGPTPDVPAPTRKLHEATPVSSLIHRDLLHKDPNPHPRSHSPHLYTHRPGGKERRKSFIPPLLESQSSRRRRLTKQFSAEQLFSAVDQNLKKKNEGRVCKVLHPHGMFHQVWDVGVLITVVISAFYTPFQLAFGQQDHTSFDLILDVCFSIDIFINFRTGYDAGAGIEMDAWKIAVHYLKTWFILDLVSAINFTLFGLPDSLGMFQLVKLARLFKLERVHERLIMNVNVHSSIMEAGKFFFYVFVVAHLFACGFWSIVQDGIAGSTYIKGNDVQAMTVSEQYITCLYWSWTTMTTIGYGDLSPSLDNVYEIVFVVVFQVIGIAFFALWMTQINVVNDSYGRVEKLHNDQKDSVLTFLKGVKMEPGLRMQLMAKIRSFLRFKSLSRFHSFTDNDPRFDQLSYALKDEIRQAIFLPAIQDIKLFRDRDGRDHFDSFLEDIDTDDVKGFIDFNEFSQVAPDMTETEIKEAMQEIGMNANNMVPVDSFYEWYHLRKFNVPLLHWPDSFLELLASHLRAMAFCPSDVVVQTGDYGLKFFMVLSGSVDVHRRSAIDSSKPKQSTQKNSIAHRVKWGAKEALEEVVSETQIPSSSSPIEDEERISRAPSIYSYDDVLRVQSTSRNPIFGFIAGLPIPEFRLMRSHTRRWKVSVKSDEFKSSTGCCDVCYIDQFDFVKLLERTWEQGPSEILRWIKKHYEVSLGDDHIEAITQGSDHYEDYFQHAKLTTKLNTATADGITRPQSGAGLAGVPPKGKGDVRDSVIDAFRSSINVFGGKGKAVVKDTPEDRLKRTQKKLQALQNVLQVSVELNDLSLKHMETQVNQLLLSMSEHH